MSLSSIFGTRTAYYGAYLVIVAKADDVGITSMEKELQNRQYLVGESLSQADIDLYAVRTKRHRLNCLQTDHKQSMAQIEKALAQVHGSGASSHSSSSTASSMPSPSASSSTSAPISTPSSATALLVRIGPCAAACVGGLVR